MIWIRKGHLLNPAFFQDGIYDILIEDDKVVAIEPEITTNDPRVRGSIIIMADGKYVMPGLVDLHVHFREPGLEYKETIATGTRAAARGGYTSVFPMPNTKPVIDSVERLARLQAIIEKDAIVHVYPVGCVTMGQEGKEVCDIAAMKKAGIYAISEDGKSVMNSGVYRKAMKLAAEENIPVFAHCEDINLVEGGVMNQGQRSREMNLPGISNAVEDVIAVRDIMLSEETGCRLHLCHCSTKSSVEYVNRASEMGLNISAEVCPHHFTLSDSDIADDDANYKMNPPLRSREDVAMLKEGLSRGIMGVISTDHAPHSKEEKSGSMKEAPFGIVGLETALALTMTELVMTGVLTKMQMVERMSTEPARIGGIDAGVIAVDHAADLIIADLDTAYTINSEMFASKGRNTPFNGKEVCGRVEYTFVNGQIVYDSTLVERTEGSLD